MVNNCSQGQLEYPAGRIRLKYQETATYELHEGYIFKGSFFQTQRFFISFLTHPYPQPSSQDSVYASYSSFFFSAKWHPSAFYKKMSELFSQEGKIMHCGRHLKRG